MRPIPPAPAPGQRILLIPAMLDAHFPLLQYAFHSKAYYPVILSQSRGLADQMCIRARPEGARPPCGKPAERAPYAP